MISLVTNRVDHFKQLGWEDYASIEESLQYFVGKHEVAYDSETSGLGFMFSKMHCFQIGDDERQFVVDLETVDIHEYDKLLTTKTLIGHNLLFDLVFLYDKGIYPYKIYDTFLAETCLSLGIKVWERGLDDCLKRYLNIDMDKSGQKTAVLGLINVGAIQYAGLDVAFIHRLKEAQKVLVDKRELAPAVELQCNAVMAVAYIELCGIGVNTEELMKWIRRNEYEEYKAMLDLNSFVAETYTDIIGVPFKEGYEKYLSKLGENPSSFDTFAQFIAKHLEEEFNWASPQQVIEFFKKIGIKTFSDKEQKDTVEETHLSKQQDKFPIIKKYIAYKKLTKIVTTYGRNWFDYIMSDGRIHTKFKPMVETGRMSCGATKSGPFPNIQNIIADNRFRKIFQVKKGRTLVKCDYSGQESVILADFSKEPKLLDFYKNGEADMHSYVAKMIYHDKLGELSLDEIKHKFPKLRQASKSANFAIAYGGNGYTIAENAGITPKEGEDIYNAFMKAFPDLKAYFDKCHKEALKNGYVLINPVSQMKRFIYGYKQYKQRGYPDNKFENTVFKMSLNTPCQGTGGDMTKHAAHLFFQWIKKNKLLGKVLMVNIVHDEIVAECSLSRVAKVADALQVCMETAGNLYLTELTIKAEPEINYCWQK